MIQKGVGVHRLRFPVSFDTRNSLPSGLPLHISAQVWLSVASDWIGFAQLERPIITYDQGTFDGHLVLVLTDEQLAVIEQRRAGADLQLRVSLDLVLGYDPGPTEDAHEASASYPSGPWPAAHLDEEIWIQSGPWQRLLEQSSVGMSLAIVLPVPIGNDLPSTRAGERLRDAIRKVNAGEYSDAVVSARKAIDAFGGDWDSEKSIVANTPPQLRTFIQRRTMLRHALWSLASPAAHSDSVADDISWDRASALSVIAAVSALIAAD